MNTVRFGMVVGFNTFDQANAVSCKLNEPGKKTEILRNQPDTNYPFVLLTDDHAALADAQPGTFKILA